MINAKPLDSIVAEDVEALIANGARESRVLEFKRDLYNLADPNSRRDAMADIVAFANSDGGDIFFGIEEKDEVAVAVPGVPLADATAMVKRITDLLQTNVEPPITSVVTRVIEIPSVPGKAFVILRVRYSPGGPHREASGRHFYERTSVSRVAMDVSTIRSTMLRQDVLFDEFDRFRTARLDVLRTNRQWHRRVGDWPALVMHVAPLHSLARHSRRYVDWTSLAPHLWRDYLDGRDDAFNAEGFFRYTPASESPAAPSLKWGGFGFHLFQDAKYEAVAGGSSDGPALYLSTIRNRLVWSWKHLIELQRVIGITPFLLGMSALQLKGSQLAGRNAGQCSVASHDPLLLPELRIDVLEGDARELGRRVESTLTPLFNAYGLKKAELDVDSNNAKLWSGDE